MVIKPATDIASPVLPGGLSIDGIACRGARAMLGLSQSDLGESAGCGRNLLNDFENGVRVPRARNVARLRQALEERGAVFIEIGGRIAVSVDPDVAEKRTPRARALDRL